jgi:molybdate transport system substrate-binding protein
MKKLLAAWLLGLAWLAPARGADDSKTVITVFAAASLTNALQDLGDAFTKESSIAVKFSFAASSALARQIESGAPADVFFSADIDWMDYLQARNLIQIRSRRDIVGNRLVLIAPVGSAIKLKIEPNFPLATALGNKRLATGDPDSVPVGRYAQAALTQLGIWKDVADRVIRADNVRSALVFVDRGEAPLGIVYETDALIDKNVRLVDVFPATSHPPIVYPVALTGKAQPAAARFVTFLESAASDAVFKAYGFVPLHP